MKKLILLMLGLFTLGNITVNAQATEKVEKTEKKVIIKKKKVDKDGKVTEEIIEAEGEDADKLIQEMQEKGELEEMEIDIEVEGGKTTKKINKEHRVIHKSGDHQKMIKVEVDAEGKKDGENVYVIKIDDGEGERVIEWTGEEGKVPADMEKYLQEGNMKIRIAKDADMEEMTVWVEDENDLPDVSVRMGVEIEIINGVVEVGSVQGGSPAESAGLTSGDKITEINGFFVDGYSGLMEQLAKYKAGDMVEVRFIRNGKAQTASLKLAARE